MTRIGRSDLAQCDTFARSGTAVFELSTRFAEPFKYPEGADEATREKARQLLFAELTQVCLWGNSVRRTPIWTGCWRAPSPAAAI